MLLQTVRNDNVELIVERSMLVRSIFGLLALGVTVFFGVLMLRIPGPTGPHSGPPPINVMWLIVAGIDLLILWYAGPHEMRLNFARRTYRGRKGFPLLAQPVAGTFQDFYGLCIRSNRNKYGHILSYRVDLDWQQQGRTPFEVLRCNRLEEAQQRQKEISYKMGGLQMGQDI